MLRRSEKHRNVRTRSRLRKFRVVSTQDGETVDPGNERSEMATVNPVRVTGTSLGHTGANDECPIQRCTASERLAARRTFESHKCTQEREKIGVEADDGPQEEVRLEVSHPKE